MNIRIRRIIMFSFILAFFVIAPILIFYASGYRYDIKRGKILKTGTMMVEAKDIKNAELFINDKKQAEPFIEKKFIYNLLPGEYNIRLQKEGYFPWQKKINIASGLTTFATNVILFKSDLPEQIIEGEIVDFAMAPDYNKLVYIKKTDSFYELYLYDLALEEQTLFYRVSQNDKLPNVFWAASSKKFLIQSGDAELVFDLNNLKQNTDLAEIIKTQPTTLKWDIASDNILYYLLDNKFYKLDLIAKNSQLFLSPEAGQINPEFFLEKNDLFYILNLNEQTALYKYNSNFKTNKNIFSLNNFKNFQFIESTNNYLGLIDLDLQKLTLIKKITNDIEINITAQSVKEFPAKNAVWDLGQKQLLIYSDFEIFTYDSTTDKDDIINRYGQTIKKAIWYPTLSYMVVLFEDRVELVDLTVEEGVHNATILANFDWLSNCFLDKKGKNLFFSAKVGEQNGLYELQLR